MSFFLFLSCVTLNGRNSFPKRPRRSVANEIVDVAGDVLLQREKVDFLSLL